MGSPKTMHSCIACGSALPEPLLVLDNMPCGAQSMPGRDELDRDRGITLPLCRCPACGLVQLDCEPVDYYRDAIRVVGLSGTMRDLRRADYALLLDKYCHEGGKWIEIGCGSGDFLEVLKEFPAEIYGTEAGEPNLGEARSKLPDAEIIEFFPDRADMDIPGAPFDCFLSFNFFEHQPDPEAMLRCAYRNLAPGGTGLITVPSLEYILDKGRYYELIRDHIANYSLASLESLCIRCGFSVLEKGFIGIGDTIRVVVRKETAECGVPCTESVKGACHSEQSYPLTESGCGSEETEKLGRLRDDYLRTRERILALVRDLSSRNKSLALWGAGHQCFTIASTTALGDYARYIIDSSDRKQGLYAPASHLPIVSPDMYYEEPVDVIMITAPGYVKEIEKTIRERYGKKGSCPAICDLTDFGLR